MKNQYLRIQRLKLLSLRTLCSAAFLSSVIFSTQTVAAELSGRFSVMWGDPFAGPGKVALQLSPAEGHPISLNIAADVLSDAGGLTKLNGQLVTVQTASTAEGLAQSSEISSDLAVTVESINIQHSYSPLQAPTLGNTTSSESRRFVSILCKFSDIADEQENLSYFQTMYGSAEGQLNHYWQEVSSNAINVDGSTAHGWYTLDKTRSHYVALIDGSSHTAMLAELFQDCVAAADVDIDFSSVYGINLMFNAAIGSYAWGGGQSADLDGVNRYFPATWEPPWAWQNVAVMAHEMGHSFGLPHSNNSDQDSTPYDNPWTVMSDTWTHTNEDATYGTIGQHLNAREKNQLGWLTSSEVYTHTTGDYQAITIDKINQTTAGTGAYRAAFIPVSTNSLDAYSVEVRRNGTAGGVYDGVPGNGVIIHSIASSRSEPAWLIDADTPAADNGDTDGVVWTTGEVFEDSENGVRIEIGTMIGDGFQITIGYPTAPAITLPLADSTLPDTEQTFEWNGHNIDTWWLYLGSNAGARDIYDSGRLVDVNATTVSGLPNDGRLLHARLFFLTENATWQHIDYTYTTAGAATILLPHPGDTLTGTVQTFTWDAGDVDEWWLFIGTAIGSRDVYDSGNLYDTTNITVTDLPANGSNIYVRLYYKQTNGSWQHIDYNYTATGTVEIISPSADTTLSSTEQTFSWQGGEIEEWWLYVGSSLGGRDIFDSGNLGSTTTTTVSNLPSDGRTLYVRLYFRSSNATWQHIDHNYTAATISTQVEITSPSPGSVLTAAQQTFQWQGATDVQNWWLYVGSSLGARDIYDSGNLTDATNISVTGIPQSGNTLHVRLFYLKAGQSWQHIDETYTANTVLLPDEYEPNNSPQTATTIALNSSQVHSIHTAQDEDWMTFTLDTDHVIEITTSGVSGDTTLTLFDNSGNQVDFNDDYNSLFSKIKYSAIAGTYLIRVAEYSDSAVMASYNITVQIAAPEMLTPQANTILIDNQQTFTWRGDDVSNWWLYVGTSEGAKDIHDSGNLGSNTSTNVSGLPTDGSLLYVRLYYRTTGGSWRHFDYLYTSHTHINADSYEPDNDSNIASQISLGEVQDHNFHVTADQDWVTFELESNAKISISTAGQLGDTTLTLYNSALEQIAYNDDDATSLFSLIEHTATAGTYYVKVAELGNRKLDAYTLTLSTGD